MRQRGREEGCRGLKGFTGRSGAGRTVKQAHLLRREVWL